MTDGSIVTNGRGRLLFDQLREFDAIRSDPDILECVDGWNVVCVDNLLTGCLDNAAALRDEPGFSFHHCDIVDGIDVSGELDAVMNFASPASPLDYQELPLETLRVGSVGTEHCLELADRKRARHLQASTSEVYGDPLVHPQPETYWGNVSTLGPRSVYDEAKRYGESLTMAYKRVRSVDTRIVRIFNTYGPRMRLGDGRVVPTFISKALLGQGLPVFGDGSQTRSFCYVDDLVEGVVRMLESDDPGPINLGNPTEMTILDLAELCVEIFGAPGAHVVHEALPEHDPKVRQPDITKARDVLGWQPEVGLRDGLMRSVTYFEDALARA